MSGTPPLPVTVNDELMARLRAGDEHAFRTIYLQHYEALFEFASTLTGNHAIAEDVVHDVFIRIWERREHFSLTGAIQLYLLKMVRNAVSNIRRHEHIVRGTELAAAHESWNLAMSTPIPLADAELEGQEFASRVAKVLRAMPPLRRGALLLRVTQGLSLRDIADILGITENAASVHIARARADLRPLLDR